MNKTEFDSKQEEYPEYETASEAEAFNSFNPEELRLKFQEINEQKQSKESIKQRRKLILRGLMLIILGLVIVLLIMWAGNVAETNKAEQEAALTAASLAAKLQNADSFMSADRPEDALRLYTEIQQTDPSYKDIGKKIQSAKQAMAVTDLYEQGVQSFKDGKNDQALEILAGIEKLHPNYKDTAQMIQKIEQEKQIASLVKEIDNLYSRKDWEGVIRNYEAILAIDPFIEIPDLKNVLFISYRNLILAFAERSDLTMKEIEVSERYYRNALALFPQSKEYVKEREELQKIAVERLANKYYLNAINLLESSNYSVKGLRESIRILTKANNIGSNSPAIKAEVEKAQLFLDSYDGLLQLKWDDAIKGLETLRRKEDGYAGGRVKYFLYEAYIARGDVLFAYADFEGAFLDYQEAEKFALGDEKNVLRMFQIETRIAVTFGKLERTKESAEFYHYAFEQLEYKKHLTTPEEQDLLNTLIQADLAYKKGDDFEAIRLYQIAMPQEEKLYGQIKISAKQGDTLANIAFENGTTIEKLRIANQIGENLVLGKDQELLVPLIAPDGQ